MLEFPPWKIWGIVLALVGIVLLRRERDAARAEDRTTRPLAVGVALAVVLLGLSAAVIGTFSG